VIAAERVSRRRPRHSGAAVASDDHIVAHGGVSGASLQFGDLRSAALTSFVVGVGWPLRPQPPGMGSVSSTQVRSAASVTGRGGDDPGQPIDKASCLSRSRAPDVGEHLYAH